MEPKELKTRAAGTPMAAQIAPWSLLAGWIVLVVYWIQAFSLTGVIRDYLLFSKAERDGAEAKSALLATLRTIQTVGATLEPLKFVGVTLIIVGISLFLIAIWQTLRLRVEATKLALAARKGK
ncbi:hypothetical protein HYS90_00835 [Candidatus Curtissbacteria bacterium]|nr:hypothetical protein [Candidatus Curtissbacteria bacterium]